MLELGDSPPYQVHVDGDLVATATTATVELGPYSAGTHDFDVRSAEGRQHRMVSVQMGRRSRVVMPR